MSGSAGELVLVERRDRVATVTLNRPEARNALSADLIATLRSTMAAICSAVLMNVQRRTK